MLMRGGGEGGEGRGRGGGRGGEGRGGGGGCSMKCPGSK